MRRNQLLTAGFVFLGLLGVTLWVLRERPQHEGEAYFTLKARTPDTLLVVFGPDTTLVVPRGETGWQVIDPVDYPADGLLIHALLQRLTNLEIRNRYPMTREKLDSYGFRHPRGLIRASYADGTDPDTLFLGGFTPNGAFDYVRAGNHPEVALVDSRVTRGYLLKSTRDLRDTRLMPFSETRAQRVEVLDGRDHVRFSASQDTGDVWRLEEPYPGLGSQKEIGEYLASLSHMHIREFVPGGEAAWEIYGLSHPALGARVRTDDGQEVGFFLGKQLPEEELVFARGMSGPQIFQVSIKYVSFLQTPAEALRRRAVVTFGLDQVDSVQVEVGNRELRVSLGSPGSRTKATPTRDVLGNWILLQADTFRPATPGNLKEFQLSPPRGQLTWMQGADTMAVMEIGQDRGGFLPLRVAAGSESRADEILLIPSTQAIPLWSYLQRQVRGGSDR